MTKEKYKEKMCKNCINYCANCKDEEIIEEIIDDTVVTVCKNYHNFAECIRKNCNSCGRCGKC